MADSAQASATGTAAARIDTAAGASETPSAGNEIPAAVKPRRARGAGKGRVNTAGGRRAVREQWATEVVELGLAFRRVARGINRLRGRDTHLPGSELSHAQFELLSELHDCGELSAGQLAAAAQLAPATVTQMLEHLALSGYVERARLECDRRVVVSRLTPRGRREIEAKRERWRIRWERALADIDAAELRAATRVLTRLQALFEDDEQARADPAKPA